MARIKQGYIVKRILELSLAKHKEEAYNKEASANSAHVDAEITKPRVDSSSKKNLKIKRKGYNTMYATDGGRNIV